MLCVLVCLCACVLLCLCACVHFSFLDWLLLLGRCVCKQGRGRWPDCTTNRCREDCGENGECRGRRCSCKVRRQRWPDCCAEKCGIGGACRGGNCVCRRRGRTWPNCRRRMCRCDQNCGRDARCRMVSEGTCACKCRRRGEEFKDGRCTSNVIKHRKNCECCPLSLLIVR